VEVKKVVGQRRASASKRIERMRRKWVYLFFITAFLMFEFLQYFNVFYRDYNSRLLTKAEKLNRRLKGPT